MNYTDPGRGKGRTTAQLLSLYRWSKRTRQPAMYGLPFWKLFDVCAELLTKHVGDDTVMVKRRHGSIHFKSGASIYFKACDSHDDFMHKRRGFAGSDHDHHCFDVWYRQRTA